jgi:His/Glu/Gln/Arg/opine family amino acid ABC transporter permease subunit
MYTFRFDVVFASLPFLLDGIRLTLVVTGVALSMGVVIGLITAVIRLARIPILNPIVAGYVEFFRGTPALVQIM